MFVSRGGKAAKNIELITHITVTNGTLSYWQILVPYKTRRGKGIRQYKPVTGPVEEGEGGMG